MIYMRLDSICFLALPKYWHVCKWAVAIAFSTVTVASEITRFGLCLSPMTIQFNSFLFLCI